MIKLAVTIVIEELEMVWGKDLVDECFEQARTIRRVAWERAKARSPDVSTIDLEPSPELVFAVALRKLFKISQYNRGDFPQTIEE
jgi:hypothetical protein